MLIETAHLSHVEPHTFTSDNLIDLLRPGIRGDLTLLQSIDGKYRTIGPYPEGGCLPPQAQHISLVSTLDEVRGFTILKSVDAKPTHFSHEPSFELVAHNGTTASVFVTNPSVDPDDILNYFIRTFWHDRHNYRICFAMPLLKNGWHLSDGTAARLRSKVCGIFDLESHSVH